MDYTPETVARCLAGDELAIRQLVDDLTPVIQTRAARVLLRQAGAAAGRNVRQDVADMTQEVFLALFDRGGRKLRAWDPARGMSFRNFVGYLPEREVMSRLRRGRTSPWTEDPTLSSELEQQLPRDPSPEPRAVSRDLLEKLADLLREQLSPRGLHLFQRLFVEQRTVPETCAELNMSANAVYAWRSRFGRLVRELLATLESESAPNRDRQISADAVVSPEEERGE